MNQLCYQSISAGISNLTLFWRSVAKYRITHINEKYFTVDESRAAWGRHKLTGHAKSKGSGSRKTRSPDGVRPRPGAICRRHPTELVCATKIEAFVPLHNFVHLLLFGQGSKEKYNTYSQNQIVFSILRPRGPLIYLAPGNLGARFRHL
jgi:hypothetical protein